MTNAVSTYLSEHLSVYLQDKNLNEDTVAAVTNDVEERLLSLLSHWNDEEFRSTLLLTALEEATFYMPLHRDVNALVVLAVRNSEHLQVLHGTEGLLNDSEIRELTTQAITYFAEVDLAQLAEQAGTPANDRFGALPAKYPVAWEALKQIALGTTKFPSKAYDPVAGNSAELPSAQEIVEGPLLEDLMQIQNGEISFLFRDSFKMISRDTDRLLYVIDSVLRAGKTVITHNYYISNGTVARRKQLLKPAHHAGDVAKKFENKVGLWNRHKDSLRLLRKFVVPADRGPAPQVDEQEELEDLEEVTVE